MGCKPGELKPAEQSNARNGHTGKTVITDRGPVQAELPRDRDVRFEPVLIPKHERGFRGSCENEETCASLPATKS